MNKGIIDILQKSKYIKFKDIQYQKWNLNPSSNFLELLHPETDEKDYCLGLGALLKAPIRSDNSSIIIINSPMEFFDADLVPIEFSKDEQPKPLLHPNDIPVNIDSERISAEFSKERSKEKMFPGIATLMDDLLETKKGE